MIPSKLLLDKKSVSNRVMFAKEYGISPDILFAKTPNSTNPGSFPKDAGIGPLNRFPANQNICRPMRFPMSSGMLPDMEFY